MSHLRPWLLGTGGFEGVIWAALQHTETHCSILQHNALQHTATHCNTLQHTATHY